MYSEDSGDKLKMVNPGGLTFNYYEFQKARTKEGDGRKLSKYMDLFQGLQFEKPTKFPTRNPKHPRKYHLDGFNVKSKVKNL